jgi:SAM-dependent methyltransferase
MQAEAITDMHRVEDRHWWFHGRRAIMAGFLRRLPLAPGASILEAGCGTGGNLALLAAFGRVRGFEPDPTARALAAARGLGTIEEGFLPDAIPFEGETFDLVVATDVLEHVEADAASVAALYARLRPGGYFLATVPACPWLWSGHDVSHHHFRRYTRAGLVAVFQAAGARVERCSYFNGLLFPAIVAMRKGKAWLGNGTEPDTRVPPRLLNGVLRRVFAAERHWLRRGNFPLGVSLVLLARKGTLLES